MISVVSFVWNRSGWRVRNHLVSITEQRKRPEEIFLVDFSTDSNHAEENALLCRTLAVTHIWQPLKMWCKSLGMNIGIKESHSEHVALIDTDQVIRPQFFDRVERFIEKYGSQIWIGAHAWMSPKSYLERINIDIAENWDSLILLCRQGGEFLRMGHPIHVLPRSWLTKTHGMNEDYIRWGAMDNELFLRAQWDGLPQVFLEDYYTFHQYHAREKGVLAQRAQNRIVFEEITKTRKIQVNPNGWGDMEAFQKRNNLQA